MDYEEVEDVFEAQEHQAAFVFEPTGAGDGDGDARPSKRRKVSTRNEVPQAAEPGPGRFFVPLLNGRESDACVGQRERLYRESWDRIERRVQRILRHANRATLEAVSAFFEGSRDRSDGKIPSAFVITGPNLASQELLFDHLGESLQEAKGGRFVRLRSSEVSNLKGTLKKIIRDATAQSSGDEGDGQTTLNQDGRRYLDYDLEGLHSFVQSHGCERVSIAFQDVEGFDGGLLSELIHLFSTWHPRIPFTLLFGVATSVELLQARLLKSTVRCIYGAQFDVVQSETLIERIFKQAVARSDVCLRLGPSLLRAFLTRQRDQVAGVQAFVSSLKYSYMSHFYANPLSVLTAKKCDADGLQAEHLEAIRSLPSFRERVEHAVEARNFSEARSLLDDDGFLAREVQSASKKRKAWVASLLRSLQIMEAIGFGEEEYSDAYLRVVAEGLDSSVDPSAVVEPIRKLPADQIVSLLGRLISLVEAGDESVKLGRWAEASDELVPTLKKLKAEVQSLQELADENDETLRSKYTSQSRIMRATVVAQKVQLSQDTADLTDQDKAFTAAIDQLTDVLSARIRCEAATSVFLHEAWLYDSRAPHRDVFVPRPRASFERSLRRPHDYLGCSCCRPSSTDDGGEGVAATMPPASLLYHLYLETGSLVNVADLWTAFYGIVGDEGEAGEAGEGGRDERTALAMFYQGLAELKALGFVKASKRKADHIAKLKWL